MACFFIVDTYIDKNKDRGSYDDYIVQVKPIVESYGGEYLARTENVTALSPLRKPDQVMMRCNIYHSHRLRSVGFAI